MIRKENGKRVLNGIINGKKYYEYVQKRFYRKDNTEHAVVSAFDVLQRNLV